MTISAHLSRRGTFNYQTWEDFLSSNMIFTSAGLDSTNASVACLLSETFTSIIFLPSQTTLRSRSCVWQYPALWKLATRVLILCLLIFLEQNLSRVHRHRPWKQETIWNVLPTATGLEKRHQATVKWILVPWHNEGVVLINRSFALTCFVLFLFVMT